MPTVSDGHQRWLHQTVVHGIHGEQILTPLMQRLAETWGPAWVRLPVNLWLDLTSGGGVGAGLGLSTRWPLRLAGCVQKVSTVQRPEAYL